MIKFRFVECEEMKDDPRFMFFRECASAEKNLWYTRLLKGLDKMKSEHKKALEESRTALLSLKDVYCTEIRCKYEYCCKECEYFEEVTKANKAIENIDKLLKGDG